MSLLKVLQLGYTKYCCILCEWESRAKTLHYLKRDWPQRKALKVREKNVQHPALAEWHKVLLPPPHIKLGLMKNFVKAIDHTGSAFKYLAEKFPRLSESKIKEGVFVGPQVRKLFRDDMFNKLLHGDKKNLGTRFVWCQLTSSGISGHKTTSNCLRTCCHCITNLVAVCS